MSAQTYTGPSGGLKKDTPWLASEDLGLGVEKTVQVEDVELHKNVKFDAGRTEAKVGALRFVGMPKAMVLNATNRKTMIRLFGMDTANWRGKWVTLWVKPDVKGVAGDIVCGLRIKEAAQVPIESPQPPVEPQTPAFDLQGLTDVGETKARAGTKALQEWWATLPPRAQHALKQSLGHWKQLAEGVAA